MNRQIGKIIGVMAMVIGMLLVGCKEGALYTNLPEKDINEMMALLMWKEIGCSKVEGTDGAWSLRVDGNKMGEAVELLKSYGLPREKFMGIGEVFKKSGLVSSPSEERIRFMDALAQELAETITKIDGVLTARVHVVLQGNDPLSELKTPSSASVFVKYKKGSGVEEFTAQIKKLVTNGIEGLSYEKISLVMVPSDLGFRGVDVEKVMEMEARSGGGKVFLMIFGVVLLVGLLGGGGWYYWMMRKRKGEEVKG